MTPALDHLNLVRAFMAPARCPKCGDWMIAPMSSEFVAGGEIRHHWECDACGESTSTTVDVSQQQVPENYAA